jgi:hypothetical protein
LDIDALNNELQEIKVSTEVFAKIGCFKNYLIIFNFLKISENFEIKKYFFSKFKISENLFA